MTLEKAMGYALCIAAGVALGKLINWAWDRWFR